VRNVVAHLVRAGVKIVVLVLHPLSSGVTPLLRHWLQRAKLAVSVCPRSDAEVCVFLSLFLFFSCPLQELRLLCFSLWFCGELADG
jgi:hypothetical protein